MDIRLSKGFFYFVLVAMCIFFVADSTNKYLELYSQGQSISVFVRFIFEVIFVLASLFIVNKLILELYLGLGLVFLCFIIGQGILIFNNHETWGDLLINIKIFNKYVFAFVLFPVVNYLSEKNNTLLNKLAIAFYMLFLLNIIISMCGFLFESELVRSYPFRDRFGYSGLVPKRNEATLFYLLGVSVSYIRYFLQGKRERFLFFLSILGAVILGTKGIYIFLIFLLFYHIRYDKKLIKNLLIIGVLLMFILVIALPQTEMYSYYYSQARRMGFLTMLLSGRDLIFFTEIGNIIENWSFANILVGGQNQNDKIFEMDFLDLFFFFGLIGSFIYLILMIKYFFQRGYRTSFQRFFMIIYLLLAFFGGHFFASAVNSLYFVIVAIYISRASIVEQVN